MKLAFLIKEIEVQPDPPQERMDISIIHDHDDQYKIVRKLPKSSGYKTLTRLGIGYEWAYLPGRYLKGTIDEMKQVLEEMYG